MTCSHLGHSELGSLLYVIKRFFLFGFLKNTPLHKKFKSTDNLKTQKGVRSEISDTFSTKTSPRIFFSKSNFGASNIVIRVIYMKSARDQFLDPNKKFDRFLTILKIIFAYHYKSDDSQRSYFVMSYIM